MRELESFAFPWWYWFPLWLPKLSKIQKPWPPSLSCLLAWISLPPWSLLGFFTLHPYIWSDFSPCGISFFYLKLWLFWKWLNVPTSLKFSGGQNQTLFILVALFSLLFHWCPCLAFKQVPILYIWRTLNILNEFSNISGKEGFIIFTSNLQMRKSSMWMIHLRLREMVKQSSKYTFFPF